MTNILPVGKLPAEVLNQIITLIPQNDPRVLLGPGIGLDCAVLEFGEKRLVLKTEPITFASQEIGWYAVQIAVNDIATTGALPKWMMITALLPEGKTTPDSANKIFNQVAKACEDLKIVIIGGHTEITYGIERPILVSTLIGEVSAVDLITPKGVLCGDHILVTKGIPIEATALLAREFPQKIKGVLTDSEISEAQNFIYSPGISVLRDAQIATRIGGVHAMHDPTEGGIATALSEMAIACQKQIRVFPENIPMPALSVKICTIFGLDPLGTIASGALLLAVDPEKAKEIISALNQAGIIAADIGTVYSGDAEVLIHSGGDLLPIKKFSRDEITRVYETI